MINKIKQNCGDVLIILGKSDKKVRNRYYYKGYFEGYTKIINFRLDIAQKGNVKNPDKPDKYGFLCDEKNTNSHIYYVWKNMERRCYYPECSHYYLYGGKGIKVSSEFKTYSKFKNWYINNSNGDFSLELDKDCKCIVDNIPKIYSSETCILLPPEINTFISTIGKGIYKTKSNTYCVRLRRVYKKVNKNFKTLSEAIIYKKAEDMSYIKILIDKHSLTEETKKYLKKYVEIFEYTSNFQ